MTIICLGARNAGQQSRSAELFERPIPEELWGDSCDAGLIRLGAPTALGASAALLPLSGGRTYVFAAAEHMTTHANELLGDYVLHQIGLA